MSRVADGLSHSHPGVRRRTVEALARYRRPDATRLIAEAFKDSDPRVREAAALAMARLGSRHFDEHLRQLALVDPSKAVRRAASAALAAMRSPD
jgi:HEAT repeat protein